MPLNRIRKEDIADVDIVDAIELRSDSYSLNSIYASTSCVSTAALIKTVTIGTFPDGSGILYNVDLPVESKDIVWIFGTSGAVGDGYYTVDQVLTDTTFTINENFGNSTGGTVQFRHPSGALKVGFDSSDTCVITTNTVQEALEELDAALCEGPGDLLTDVEHPKLRQLIHLADGGVGGPYEGFLSGAYREVIGPLLTPSNITWYVSASKTAKIVDKNIIYNGVLQPTVIQWQAYKTDGYSVLASVTDNITYNIIFETSRLRTIIDYGSAIVNLTRQTHKTLRQLIHLADSDGVGGPFEGFPTGAYRETTYPMSDPFEITNIWYDDNTKAKKIVEHTIVRNSINMPVTITWKVYDVDGSTILSTVSDSIVYANNIFEVSRTRTIT